MEDFTNFYEMEIPFDCIYLDFAKAFDRVSHQRLLTKLYNIGIRGNLMNWIKDFLKGREQRVVVVVCPLQPSSSFNSGCPGPESSILVSSRWACRAKSSSK